jgi:hypothetical protein
MTKKTARLLNFNPSHLLLSQLASMKNLATTNIEVYVDMPNG